MTVPVPPPAAGPAAADPPEAEMAEVDPTEVDVPGRRAGHRANGRAAAAASPRRPTELDLSRVALLAAVRARLAIERRWAEAGQGTVEYALVLLGAAAVALALVAWVARSDAVGRLFDGVMGRVLSS